MTSLPLRDIFVLDVSMHLSGPFASRMLADLGARIVKVEPYEGRGPTSYPGGKPAPNLVAANCGKESIAIDLKTAGGKAVFLDLARRADVVLENFRPGVTQRLGIDYETLRRINPALIYCTITGFGSNGPLAARSAFDSTIQAMSGAMFATGEPDRPPALMTVNLGDLAASCISTSAIIAALHGRAGGDGGRHIDISMLECLLFLMVHHTQTFLQDGGVWGRHGSGYGPGVIAGAMECRDGKYVQLVCPYPKFQESLQRVIAMVPGFEEAAGDPRFSTTELRLKNSETFLQTVRDAFKRRSRDEWLAVLEDNDVPSSPIYDVGEALGSEQLAARGAISSVRIPECGIEMPILASPFDCLGNPGAPRALPAFAQHTSAILREFGYSDEEIARLTAERAIKTRPENVVGGAKSKEK
jgi:crotonobetainyl-CoA:carnitine CoA-transferase CaiB-like acyl-CoA transferase